MFDNLLLKSKVPASGFETPTDYFVGLDERILNTVNETSVPKVIRMNVWKSVAAVAAIAACVLLMFNVFIKPDNMGSFESLETASIENYISEEDFTEYELASFLKLDNLTADAFVTDGISEENLEDYLLQNTDLEALFIE